MCLPIKNWITLQLTTCDCQPNTWLCIVLCWVLFFLYWKNIYWIRKRVNQQGNSDYKGGMQVTTITNRRIYKGGVTNNTSGPHLVPNQRKKWLHDETLYMHNLVQSQRVQKDILAFELTTPCYQGQFYPFISKLSKKTQTGATFQALFVFLANKGTMPPKRVSLTIKDRTQDTLKRAKITTIAPHAEYNVATTCQCSLLQHGKVNICLLETIPSF